MYRMKFDSLSAVVTKKKRGRFLMLSTSILQRENTTASNSQEIPALTSPSQRVVFLAEQLMTKDAGSFEYPKDYHAAYDLFGEIVGDANSSSKAINVSVFLLERAVREYSHYLALHVKDMHNTNKSSKNESWWFCNPLVVSSVFNLWKDAAIRNEDVLSPRDMVQKLQNMSVLLPERFRYNISTMNIIMHVLIRKEPLHRAPFVAENLFDFIAAESAARAVHGDSSMQPTSHTYSMVLHAWSQSRLSNAAAKIEQIMATLHKEYCANPELIAAGELVPYAIWIRYWSNLGNAEKVDSILSLLDGNEHLHARVGGNILSHAIYCYTKVGQIKKAELVYDRMISLGPPTTMATNSADSNNIFDDDERRGLMLGSFYLINYYRQVIVALIGNTRVIPQRCEVQIHQYSERAEAVLRQVEEFREIDPESVGTLRI
jgi:pentatricopeptide repeat protein